MNDKVSIEAILNFTMNIPLTYDLGFYSLPTRKHGANMNLFRWSLHILNQNCG